MESPPDEYLDAGADVVLVTEDRFENPAAETLATIAWEEEHLFVDALEHRGARVRRVSWSNPRFDWTRAGMAVVRSTWDYVERFDAFCEWVIAAERQTRLVNSPELVRWNWDKSYLGDLQRRGIRIPATRFLAAGNGSVLRRIVEETGWDQAVLKPTVSAGAFETFRLSPDAAETDRSKAAGVLDRKPMLLQEYLPAIEQEGELSLVLFGGEFSHAIRKTSRAGDFRVQIQHGGRAERVTPAAEEIELARQVVAVCSERPVYARVDLVRDRIGKLCLMELELIEPDLFCRQAPGSAERFASALLAR